LSIIDYTAYEELVFIGADELLPEALKNFNTQAIISVIFGALRVSTLKLLI